MDTSVLIHLLSILLQVVAIFLAFRLIPLSGRRLAWILLSVAFLLMGARRLLDLLFAHSALGIPHYHALYDSVGWITSLLIVVGVYLIRDVFLAHKQAEEKFQTLATTAQDAIVIMEGRGKVSFWSAAAERLFGYTAGEALGRPLHELIVPARFREAALKGISGFVRTGQGLVIGKTVELRALRRDGTEFDAEHSISAVRIGDGWCAMGVVRDITARKEAERSLQEQLDELRRFEKLAVGRELRVKELVEENRALKDKLAKLERS